MEGLTKHLEEVRQQAAGVIDLVLADMRQKWAEINSGPSVVEGVKGFVRSVDWAEPWLQILLTMHVLLLGAVVYNKDRWIIQGAIFVLIMPVIFFAERINVIAGQRWQEFSAVNYFDKDGIFASAVLSAPLLLIMFVILFNYLFATSALLVKMKRKELELKAREAAAAAKKAGGKKASGSQAAAAATPEPKKAK